MLKPTGCKGCVLEDKSKGFSVWEGEGTNGVLVIGEYLGNQEFIDGLPLRPHAQAGSCFEQALKLVTGEVGYPVTRKQFGIYNIVNCYPQDWVTEDSAFKVMHEAVGWCQQYVDKCVEYYRPRCILALGNLPLKYLGGVSGVAKEKQSIAHLRGFVLPSRYGVPMVASYNPAFIRRGKADYFPLLVADVKRTLEVSRGEYVNYNFHSGYVPPKYQIAPSVDEVKSFYYRVKDAPRKVLSYDIETQDTAGADEDERDELESTEIVLVQFSVGKGEGIAVPFTPEYRSSIDGLFGLENVKANHNAWNFDNPRLRAKGVEVRGKIHDTMWMFKHWQPRLPRGLQAAACVVGFPFAWKHLYGSQLEWYGCADVDAVQWLLGSLPAQMKRLGVWDGYIEYVYNVNPIFEGARYRGIPVNEGARVELDRKFRAERAEIHKKLQGIVPEEIRNVKPRRKDKVSGAIDYGYKREPKIIGEELERYNRLSKELRLRGKRTVSFGEFLWRKHQLAYVQFENVDGDTKERTTVERWAIVEEFKASSQQLIRYLKWKQDEINTSAEKLRVIRDSQFAGRNKELTEKINEIEKISAAYAVPKNLKTKRDTTNAKELEEMYIRTGDPVLELVADIRSYDTNINNYIPNWKPGKDGRVHPTYGYTPPQGQIHSWRPNSQNVSKHTEFGKEFRRIIEAPEGYTFVEFDKKSFHVGTMGYVANDRDYIRFSQIDPHSILGSYIDPSVIGGSISLKWSDEDIRKAAGEFKKRCEDIESKGGINVRQRLAKPTVLGNQLGLGAKKLQSQNRRFIATVAEAEKFQAFLQGLFPKAEVFKKWIKDKATIEHILVDEFGRCQWFWDVYQWVRRRNANGWDRKDGEGAREPIAFRVQGSAFGMITEEMLEMNRRGWMEEYGFMTTIHDSVIFMPEKGKLGKCIEDVTGVMNAPCGKLVNEATGAGGLAVRVDVAAGKNWKEMKGIKA